MNIKSLLLGSAAALVAVTGARAADPIMPEADPAQYVGVCTVGDFTGYLIPGTETCLKVGGSVRFLYGVIGEVRNLNGDTTLAGSRVRGRVNFDAREDTEFGVLRAFVQIQGENTFGGSFGSTRNGTVFVPAFPGQVPVFGSASFGALSAVDDSTVIVDNAYIQLGGLTMGYLDSLWAERDGLFTDTDWSVGDFKSNRISYTYADAGFSAAISLEDAALGDFEPDVVGQVAYDGGAFAAYLSGVYDSTAEAFGTNLVGQRLSLTTGLPLAVLPTSTPLFTDPYAAFDGDAAFALKGAASIKNLLSEGSELKVEGHYAFDPTVYAVAGLRNGGFSGTSLFNGFSIPSEYQVGVGYKQPIGPFGVSVSAALGETFDLFSTGGTATAANPNGFINLGSTDYYLLGLNVGYAVTKNFEILTEVTYRDLDLPSQFDDFDQTTGFISFTRKF